MRHIFTLSAFTALLSLFSVTASAYDIAVENADEKTIYYNFINDGTELEVTYEEYDNYSTYWYDIVIPDKVTYDGKTYSVTSIGEEAFYDAVRITSITIPGSVKSIGLRACCGCSRLKTVTILGNGLESIGAGAFANGPISTINIPNSVTSIGNSAFKGCSFTSITIPNGVTSIAEDLFMNCYYLTSVTIPASVTSIGNSAF